MLQVMNAWRPRPRGGNVRKAKNPPKGVLRHAGGDPLIPRRQKHVVVRHGQLAPLLKVLIKCLRRCGVQGDQPAFTELGAPNVQDAIRQYVSRRIRVSFNQAELLRFRGSGSIFSRVFVGRIREGRQL